MAINLFGFRIGKPDDEIKKAEQVPSFAPPPNNDGAVEIAPGGAYGTFVDLEGTAKTEAELVTRYREMAMQPECDYAIDDIVNESIVTDERSLPVEINLDELEDIPENIKEKIRNEFDAIAKQLDFSNLGYEIFRRWYVDGRLYYHIMIDEKNPRAGIQELRYIDPRRIRKIREPIRTTPAQAAKPFKTVPAYNEYYLYNPSGLAQGTVTQGTKISKDSICYVHSGLLDQRNRMVLSHLHKALKPLNQLRMLEDATVIYRLARAPERRIFYIDVGNLPKMKADQYVRDMMVKHKNRLVYDANTGEVRDDRKFMTMLEDFWLPRREGGRGTEITTLPGGENLGEMTDVEYFRKKLYKSLGIPVSRLESDGQFNIGRSSEITRDEVKFSKFVDRLRNRFGHLFDNLLEIQLALKGVMTREEFRVLKNSIKYDFMKDNHFSEMKEQEILNSRLNTLQQIDIYVGKYYSQNWIQKNVLRMSSEEIEEIGKEIEGEHEDEEGFPGMAHPELGIVPPGSPVPPAGGAAPQPPMTKAKSKTPKKKEEKKPTVKKEEVESQQPKPLSEEEKKLVESMTRLIEGVTLNIQEDDISLED